MRVAVKRRRLCSPINIYQALISIECGKTAKFTDSSLSWHFTILETEKYDDQKLFFSSLNARKILCSLFLKPFYCGRSTRFVCAFSRLTRLASPMLTDEMSPWIATAIALAAETLLMVPLVAAATALCAKKPPKPIPVESVYEQTVPLRPQTLPPVGPTSSATPKEIVTANTETPISTTPNNAAATPTGAAAAAAADESKPNTPIAADDDKELDLTQKSMSIKAVSKFYFQLLQPQISYIAAFRPA